MHCLYLLSFFLSLTACFVPLPLLLAISGAVTVPSLLAFPNVPLWHDEHLPVLLPVGQAGRARVGGTVFPSAQGPRKGLWGCQWSMVSVAVEIQSCLWLN